MRSEINTTYDVNTLTTMIHMIHTLIHITPPFSTKSAVPLLTIPKKFFPLPLHRFPFPPLNLILIPTNNPLIIQVSDILGNSFFLFFLKERHTKKAELRKHKRKMKNLGVSRGGGARLRLREREKKRELLS